MILHDAEGGSLVRQATRAIRTHIRENDLKVGDVLPGEGHFATTLGVSRAVMREAFGGLAALGVLDVGNGRRAKVGAIDGSVMAASLDHAVATAQVSFAEVWDVRRTVEVRIADLAARNRTDAQAEAIVRHALAMRQSVDDPPQLARNDIALHLAIAEASGNGLFKQMVRSYVPLMLSAVPQAWQTRRTETDRAEMLDLHERLAAAVADRDSAVAAAAMDTHFDASISDLIDAHILEG